MPRKEHTRSIRVEESLAKRAEGHAARLNLTLTRFCEEAVRSICDMAEHPEDRVVPVLIRQIDALNQPPPPLGK